MISLRDYQQEAVDAMVGWLQRPAVDADGIPCPAVVEAATGAGKTLIISAVTKQIRELAKTDIHVLVLAPSKELVEQNSQKYREMTGEPCSIYCASISKSLRHPVVFGSPKSVANSVEKMADKFKLVIIDECHGITNTVKKIISRFRQANKLLRVVGLTATPYRMGSGYIYEFNQDNMDMVENQLARDPYFKKLLYRITARDLVNRGYLTPPHADRSKIQYDTSELKLNSMFKFDAAAVRKAFENNRLTGHIMREVLMLSEDRMGVMIFASTVQHAKECLASLPEHLSALVSADTPKSERERILAAFKARELKYIVNVAVLTTGFDATHVDTIAVLRATESPGLFQQIIGRGLRLHEEKTDTLVLDYAGNISRHCPDGDMLEPTIEPLGGSSGETTIDCECPDCGNINTFKARPNRERFPVNQFGFFVDLEGTEIGSAHFGRRCTFHRMTSGIFSRCNFRWEYKECSACEHKNDIAAKYCEKCNSELIDPNEKLAATPQMAVADPSVPFDDEILSWSLKSWVSRHSGKHSIKVDISTEHKSFTIWISPASQHQWYRFCVAIDADPASTIEEIISAKPLPPKAVCAVKDGEYWKVSRWTKFKDDSERNARLASQRGAGFWGYITPRQQLSDRSG